MKNYLSSSFAKKCFTVATLFFFLMGQSAFAAVSLTNGNFSDTSGMSDIGGGWYDGVPTGWSTTGANQYVINNEVLNLDHVGTFSQTLGVVDAGAEDVTVSFQYGDIWNGGYYAANEDMITAELWDTTTTTLLVSKTVKNTGSYGSFVSDSLSATATAGNTLQVRFSSLVGTGVTPGDAAALDNVSVTAVDATAPIISNVRTEVLYPAGLSIRWTTNEPATSQVQFGLTNAYGSTSPLNSNLVTEHIVDIHGLDTPAQYYFEIITTDPSGNIAITTTSGTGTTSTSEGGSGGVTSTGGGLFQTPITPAQPTAPDSDTNTQTPANPTPENNPTPAPETPTPESTPETTPETPAPETPEPTPTPNPNPGDNSELIPTSFPNGATGINPSTGGGTGSTGTGGTGGTPAPFNPADATLDIGGGVEPDATDDAAEEGFDPADATLDQGGGEPGQESSYTLLWILLGLLALLNTWWFFVAKNKQNIHRN